MSTFTCPDGHQSADPDWCDTCGLPIPGGNASGGGTGGGTGGGAPAGGPVTTPTATVTPSSATPPPFPGAASVGSVACSHCGAANEADALFCESCGFDFTTGQAPPPPKAPASALPDPADTGGPSDFSVQVSVDPAWYALQGTDSNEPCPPPTSVTLAVRGTTVLIGRTSAERAINPEVALNDDPGVSRRHAQIVQAPDGSWSVVDLESMNGTYVVADGVPPTTPPAPIEVGQPVALPAGGRVFVGAWSCITLIDNRAAAPAAAPTSPEPT